MDIAEYEAMIEKKLVKEFREVYHQKLGYYPVVRTKYDVSIENIGYMSLERLMQYFTPFLPQRYGETLKMSSRSRFRELVEIRFIFCHIAKHMKYSPVSIGTQLGNRDRTTVMYGLSTFNDLIQTSEGFREKYKTILKYIIQEQEHLNVQIYESSTMEPVQDLQSKSEPALLP